MKRTCVILVLLAAGLTPADDRTKVKDRDAREVLEAWVAAALAGKVEEAVPFGDPGTSLGTEKGVKKFKELLGVASLKVPTVCVSEKQGRAAAVSEAVKLTKANPDGRDAGVVSFKLNRVKGKWLLKDVDFDMPEKARQKVKDFREKYPDARDLPAGKKD